MKSIEIAVTVIGVAGSLFGIYEGVKAIYHKFRKKPLDQLMNDLVNKNTPMKKQRSILRKMQVVLAASGIFISNDYINAFNADGRGKFNVFRDICTQNKIEPTRELCIQLLGSDDAQFRREWANNTTRNTVTNQQPKSGAAA